MRNVFIGGITLSQDPDTSDVFIDNGNYPLIIKGIPLSSLEEILSELYEQLDEIKER